MPLNYTAAHSSRIPKSSAKRPSSSPFSAHQRRKPVRRTSSKSAAHEDEADDFFSDRLEDRGLVNTLAADLSLRDVVQTVKYIRGHMFDDLPEGGGFNSVRTAEVLNFRKSLPPTVTVAHVHAFMYSPTNTEKETAELAKAGVIRKVLVPGRGIGGCSIAEGVILFDDLERLIHSSNLDDKISSKHGALSMLQMCLLRREIRDLPQRESPRLDSPKSYFHRS